jgi:hypothetical protein
VAVVGVWLRFSVTTACASLATAAIAAAIGNPWAIVLKRRPANVIAASSLISKRIPTTAGIPYSTRLEATRAAHPRGASDLSPGERPSARPLALLATAVPRLISLAVAANVLHILPTAATGRGALADELLSTIDMTASGGLYRCHLALGACGRDAGADTAEEWLPYIYDETAHHLHALSPTANPPSLVQHAQEAGRYTAIAIGALDRDAAMAPEAISDCLAHLLTVCVFANTAAGKPSP